MRFIFRRPQAGEDEVVIGGEELARIQPVGPSLEAPPVVFRPSIDPASPTSRVGAGAAAAFQAMPHEDEETPEEDDGELSAPSAFGLEDDATVEDDGGPEQLGLPMEQHGAAGSCRRSSC